MTLFVAMEMKTVIDNQNGFIAYLVVGMFVSYVSANATRQNLPMLEIKPPFAINPYVTTHLPGHQSLTVIAALE